MPILVGSVVNRVKVLLASTDDDFFNSTEIIDWSDEAISELFPYIPEETLTSDFFIRRGLIANGYIINIPNDLLRLKTIERIRGSSTIYIPSDILEYSDYVTRKDKIKNIFNTDFPTSCFHSKVGNSIYIFPDAINEGMLITYYRKYIKRTDETLNMDIPDELISPVVNYCVYRGKAKQMLMNDAQFYLEIYEAYKNKLMGVPYREQPPRSGYTPSDKEKARIGK